MDNTKEFTHLGLCAGYGGIELGLHRVIRNLRTVALCEIEAFACANLVAKMEAGLMDCAPIWTNLKTFPWADFRDRVDILTGGYPCQPFSAAGKRLGTEDPRHLWPFIADGIRILRPKLCFFENVEGHISLGLREVIGELGAIGYTAAWGIFSASEVGAPHRRKRVFILAYRICDGHDWRELQDRVEGWASGELPQSHEGESCGVWSEASRCGQVWPSRPGEPQHAWEPPRVVSSRQIVDDTQERCLRVNCNDEGQAVGQVNATDIASDCSREGELGNATQWQDHGREPRDLGQAPSQGGCGDHAAYGASEVLGHSNGPRPQERTGQRGAGIQGIDADGGTDAERQTQPPLGRDADGPAGGLGYAELCVSCDNRTDELRLLGNGVVPATAERAFLTLMQELLKGKN